MQEEQGYFQSIKNYVRDLRISDLSPLLNKEKVTESGQNFFSLANAARGTGPEAMQALSQLQGSAQTYLEQSRGFYSSSNTYSQIFGTVESILNEFGSRTNYTAYENAQLELDNDVRDLQQDALTALNDIDHSLATFESALDTQFASNLATLTDLTKTQQAQIDTMIQQLALLRAELAAQTKAVVASNDANGDKVARSSRPVRQAVPGR